MPPPSASYALCTSIAIARAGTAKTWEVKQQHNRPRSITNCIEGPREHGRDPIANVALVSQTFSKKEVAMNAKTNHIIAARKHAINCKTEDNIETKIN